MQKKINAFSEKAPIFIDANIFLHHAFNTNADSIEFLKKVESSRIRGYTSALVLEEVVFKLVMQSASNLLEPITFKGVKGLLKKGDKKRSVFRPVIAYMQYIEMLNTLGLGIIELTGKDMMMALQKAQDHGLMTADAAHLAVMDRKGIEHLASSDKDFASIETISVWAPEVF
jgi:predicted nucleic acid-binding protein